MTEWMGWFIAAGVVLVLELFTGTFYLLMMSIGIAVGGIAALSGLGGPLQAITAAVAGTVATLLLRRTRFARRYITPAQQDPNVNMDIGQTLTVAAWQDGKARVMYRGALWDVILAAGAIAVPGVFTIREIRGSCLIVS